MQELAFFILSGVWKVQISDQHREEHLPRSKWKGVWESYYIYFI